ncbi:MAG: methyltransferase domain-containing protein [Dehalococcoidia bacterium]|nr:methyltransferase domain-containing protein [Dehalococcoidia bacterium]
MSRFDELAASFAADQRGPWPELSYRLFVSQLEEHRTGKLRVLDAGGGAGALAVRLARDGHDVTLLDQSEGMLAQARDAAAEAGVVIRILESTIEEADDLIPEPEFDLVACHNVLEYVVNLADTIRSLRRWMRPDGLLSLVVHNAVSLPLWCAMHELNFEEALVNLGARTWRGRFSDSARAFDSDEISGLVSSGDLTVVGSYGLGVVSPYIPDEDAKFTDRRIHQLEELERRLGSLSPYKEVARRLHVVAAQGEVRND